MILMKISIIAALCLLVVLICGCCTFTRRFLAFPSPEKARHIRGPDQRIVVYHGVNIANQSKHSSSVSVVPGMGIAGHPWHSGPEFDNMENWGFNLARYLIYWEAVEPQRGVYDDAYLDTAIQKIRELGERGVDVVVDFHQDLYAQRYHGNGFPEWSVRDDGKSFKLQEPWAMNYFQPAVRACFDNFWSNKDGLLDAYVAMVEHVLVRVNGIKNVIAVDVMNEPWPKRWPLTFERKILSEFYKRLSVMWIKHNNGFPNLAFEPWMSTSAGYPSNLRMKNFYENFFGLLYMPHYYDFFCEQNKPYKWFNRQVMKRGMNIRSFEAQEFECPMIIGEFSFPPTSEGNLKALNDFLRLADKHRVGWTYWSFDKACHNDRALINDDGTVAKNGFLKSLVRIYPQRIAGTNHKYDFDGTVFRMTWDYDASSYISPISGTTEVFVPRSWDVLVDTKNPYCRVGNKILVEPLLGQKWQTVRISVLNRNGFPL
jgi:endoglycosylceramidase